LLAVSEPSVPTTIVRNMGAKSKRYTSLIVAMIMLASTHTKMIACIQIQNGDTPRRLSARAPGYSAGRRTTSSVIARILKSSPSVQCSM